MARIKSESGSISFSRFVSDSCVCLKKPLIAVSVDRHFNSVDRYSVSCCRKILIHSSGVFGWALKKKRTERNEKLFSFYVLSQKRSHVKTRRSAMLAAERQDGG